MDYLKNITNLPSLKMPSLRSLYSESMANLKEEGTNVLTLMSCNLFRPKKVPKSQYERQTIQSEKISTISSLVDKDISQGHANESIKHEAQRDNYGLYALKCNRSAATKRNSIQINQSKRYYQSSSPSSPIHDVNHEAFSPCQSLTDETMHSLNYHREYYKIEFSEEGGLKEVSKDDEIEFKSNSTATNRNGKEKDNNNINVFQIPPPRRKKFAPTICGTAGTSTNEGKSIFQTPPQLPSSTVLQNSNKLVKTFPETNLSFNSNQCGKTEKFQDENLNKDPWCSMSSPPSTGNQLNLKKNRSELYRIRNRMFSNSFESNSSIESTGPKDKHPVNRLTNIRRKPSNGSVNIFNKNSNDINVFDDFNEVLSFAPVVEIREPTRNGKHSFIWRENSSESFSSVFSTSSDIDQRPNFNKRHQTNSIKKINSDVITNVTNEVPAEHQSTNKCQTIGNHSSYHQNNKLDVNFNLDRQVEQQDSLKPQQTDEGDGLCIQQQICNKQREQKWVSSSSEHELAPASPTPHLTAVPVPESFPNNNNEKRLSTTRNVYRIMNLVTV